MGGGVSHRSDRVRDQNPPTAVGRWPLAVSAVQGLVRPVRNAGVLSEQGSPPLLPKLSSEPQSIRVHSKVAEVGEKMVPLWKGTQRFAQVCPGPGPRMKREIMQQAASPLAALSLLCSCGPGPGQTCAFQKEKARLQRWSQLSVHKGPADFGNICMHPSIPTPCPIRTTLVYWGRTSHERVDENRLGGERRLPVCPGTTKWISWWWVRGWAA